MWFRIPACLLIVLLALAFSSSGLAQVTPRIIGGGQANAGDHPWMAALVEKDRTPANGQLCGGMLVAPQWVLTAAHCVEGENRNTLDIWVGLTDLRVTAGAQKRNIQTIIRHPNYRTDRWDNLYYDVALILLDRPVTGVTPIVLASQSSHNDVGEMVRALGWGSTHPDFDVYPNILRQADLVITDLADSQADYQNILGPSHLAAAVPDFSRDTCVGDSGGPLFRIINNDPILVGVVSFGDGCAVNGVEGIYANVLFLRDWITDRLQLTANPPDLNVRYRGRALANGDRSASRFEGTNFGRVRAWSRGKKRTFRIHNEGAGLLTIGKFRVPNSHYDVIRDAPSLVGAGGSPAVRVNFSPRRRGRIVTNMRLLSNDPAKPYFWVRLVGKGR